MKEYKTTVGSQESNSYQCSDPCPPENDGRGDWRLVCATADECRLYWFWEREAGDGSK